MVEVEVEVEVEQEQEQEQTERKRMEDSFEVRVKRLFGSHLFESVPRNSFPASSWSVADGEVERREWNRQRDTDHGRSEEPCSSAFADDGCLAKQWRSSRIGFEEESEQDLDELEDDGDGEGRREENGEDRGDLGGEEAEIRSSIGLDPTLDNEDEEDEYDRAAVCRDDAGERLYMRDVKKVGCFLNYHNICEDMVDEQSVGSSLVYKDPRADHFAATARLEEDQKVVGNFNIPGFSKDTQHNSTCSQRFVDHDVNLKPILKRKEGHDDSKPRKRVRFDPGCKADDNEVSMESRDSSSFSLFMEVADAADQGTITSTDSTDIPDYIRNPSKYTHYTFDSYEDNDAANSRAFEGFRSLYQKTNPEQVQNDDIVDLPKTLTFTKRRKLVDAMPVDKGLGDAPHNGVTKELEEGDLWSTRSTGIAAGESYGNDGCRMEEDDADIPWADAKVGPSSKGRQYRSRSTADD